MIAQAKLVLERMPLAQVGRLWCEKTGRRPHRGGTQWFWLSEAHQPHNREALPHLLYRAVCGDGVVGYDTDDSAYTLLGLALTNLREVTEKVDELVVRCEQCEGYGYETVVERIEFGGEHRSSVRCHACGGDRFVPAS